MHVSTVERAAGGVKSHRTHGGSQSAGRTDAIAYIYENAHGSITLLLLLVLLVLLLLLLIIDLLAGYISAREART